MPIDYRKAWAEKAEIHYGEIEGRDRDQKHMLVHGSLNPDKTEHEVVKYCYLILWDLMDF